MTTLASTPGWRDRYNRSQFPGPTASATAARLVSSLPHTAQPRTDKVQEKSKMSQAASALEDPSHCPAHDC